MTSDSENENAGMPLAVAGALCMLCLPITMVAAFLFAFLGFPQAQQIQHRAIAQPSTVVTTSSDGVTTYNFHESALPVLGGGIKMLLLVSLAVTGLGLIGIILLLISIFGCKYRGGWLFWYLLIYGILSLIAVPIGTIIGIGFLAIAFTHMDQFQNREESIREP